MSAPGMGSIVAVLRVRRMVFFISTHFNKMI